MQWYSDGGAEGQIRVRGAPRMPVINFFCVSDFSGVSVTDKNSTLLLSADNQRYTTGPMHSPFR